MNWVCDSEVDVGRWAGIDMGLICGELRGGFTRGPICHVHSPKTKNKNKKCFFLKSQRCEHTPLKYSPTKKEDLARGLKCSHFGGLVNDKYWHVKDAAGGFSGQVW